VYLLLHTLGVHDVPAYRHSVLQKGSLSYRVVHILYNYDVGGERDLTAYASSSNKLGNHYLVHC
jgi:hypothetical protein